MPKEEFLARIAALWRLAPAASHAIVFGSPAHHAELAWFTNLVPKLEATVTLLARNGEHRLYVGGGPNMLGAARPLSWITDMAPLNGLSAALRQIEAKAPPLLIGGGYMPAPLHQRVGEALAMAPQDVTAAVWTLMRRKTPHEIDAIRSACDVLTAAMKAMHDAQRAGAGATDVVLAGERAANEAGAQDVRTLFSLDRGRTLMPFGTPVREAVDPLQVYMAVRRFNYWAEGFAPLSLRGTAAVEKASTVLHGTVVSIKAGTHADDIMQTVAAEIAPFGFHPVAARLCSAVGLALEESPHTDIGDAFTAGEIYSLRVGITDGAEQHAIVSAIMAVNDGGSELLWSDRDSI
jgi:hypothetical protein